MTQTTKNDRLCQPTSLFGFREDVVNRLVVGVDAPFLNQPVLHHGHPRRGCAPFVFGWKLTTSGDGSARCAEHCDDVSALQDLLVRNPVVRTECEIPAPPGPHLFAGADGLAQRVDKDVIFGHQRSQLVGIEFIDAFQKSENGLGGRHKGNYKPRIMGKWQTIRAMQRIGKRYVVTHGCACYEKIATAMAILVTGSAGHLGEALMRTLLESGCQASGLDCKHSAFTHRVGSVTDRDFVKRSMPGVHAVLHTATLHKPHVATQTRQDFVDTNITGTLNLLEEAVAAGVESLFLTRTTRVFGDAPTPPAGAAPVWVAGEGPPVPKNIYGVTKPAARG